MANIYNLSYDISKKLADENHVDLSQRLDHDSFVEKLCADGLISLSDSFVVEGEPNGKYHIVLRPVETTMMFFSNKSLDELNNYLSQYANQLYYLITEVKDEDISGYSHIDYSHQNKCDEIIKELLTDDIVDKVVQHVLRKLKQVQNDNK